MKKKAVYKTAGKAAEKFLAAFALALGAALFWAACSDNGGLNPETASTEPIPAIPVEITVNTSVRHQQITGFGGMSPAWSSPAITLGDIDALYGEGGLGYSIFRIILYHNPSDWPRLVPAARRAKDHGALILASPWTPPVSLKSNSSNIGGSLLSENYGVYAAHLRDFLNFMAGQGVPVDVVSIQNEPDIRVDYDSCDWTPQQMLAFVKSYGRQIGDVKIIPGESFQFRRALTDPLLNDFVAVNNFDIVGGHIYGGGLSPYPLAAQKGKEVWMTEHLLNTGNNYSNDITWPSAMVLAQEIHRCMQADFNAYIWWYLKRFYSMVGDGEYGSGAGQIMPRGYVMSHYAKYATGKQRIDASASGGSNVAVTAYEGGGSISLVVINSGNQPLELTVKLPLELSSASAVESVSGRYMQDKPVSIDEEEKTVTVELGSQSIASLLLAE